MYRILFFLLPLLALATCQPAEPPAAYHSVPISPSLDSAQLALARRYHAWFDQQMQLTGTPGAAVVIVQDSQVLLLRGYGVRAIGRPDSVDAHTVFRLGSLSKGFAGVLAGRLVQEGRLAWDEPVYRRLPQFALRDRQQAARIRLWHLLSHTTGLPYHAFTNLIENGYERNTIVHDYLPKAPISGREGEFYAYQNVVFCLVEDLALAATGQSYPTLLQQKIFDPLHMHDASCSYDAMRQAPNQATPHLMGAGWLRDTLSRKYYDFAAAGGVNASAADMAEWLRLLLGYRPDVVTQSTLAAVFRPVVATDKERQVLAGWIGRHDASYAMGWRVLRHEGHTLVYHGGYVNGFRAEIAFDRERRVGICVLLNAHSDLSGACIREFFEMLK
jgi:beta-lactamase class C